MKFNKIIMALLAGSAMVLTTSCNEETEYTPAAPAPLEPYYFTTYTDTYQELVDGKTSFTVYMGRANDKGELTVPFTMTCDVPGAFTAPTSASFADGENTLSFEVNYDLTQLEVNKEYKLNLTIEGIENTPYCYGSLDITAIYVPWRKFDKKGIYRDASVGGLLLGIEDGIQYEVEIEEHPSIDGIYRIVNPYGPESFPYNSEFDYDDSQNYYMVINATNPNRVFVEPFFTGLVDSEYGEISLESFSVTLEGQNEPEVIEKAGAYAFLENGIIRYPEGQYLDQTILVDLSLLPSSSGGTFGYIGNKGGMFKVVLPGFEDEPDEPEWEEMGWFNYTDSFVKPLLDETDNTTWSVLVEKSLVDEGIYRIINPYGAESGLSEENQFDGEMIIDASTPELVLINPMQTSITANNKPQYGNFFIFTLATYAMMSDNTLTEDDVLGMGGDMENNVITFPADNCGGYFSGKRSWMASGSSYDGVLDLSKPVEAPAKKNILKGNFNFKNSIR